MGSDPNNFQQDIRLCAKTRRFNTFHQNMSRAKIKIYGQAEGQRAKFRSIQSHC